MESFYGGKQGASFVIKNAFKYVDKQDPAYVSAVNDIERSSMSAQDKTEAIKALENNTMESCFSNPKYKDVWYGEYCIIDSPNKNNENNGRIYRRTLKRRGSGNEGNAVGGYAEYIGQVSGPAGPTLQLGAIGSVAAIEAEFDKIGHVSTNDWIKYLNSEGEESNEYISSTQSTDLFITPLGGDDVNAIKFIPGNAKQEDSDLPDKYFDNNGYLQSGGYNWYYTRMQAAGGDISEVFLGFDIPYHMIDFNDIITPLPFIEDPAITSVDLGKFYTQYSLSIPEGIIGGYFGNFHIEEYDNTKKYYIPTDISYSVDDGYSIPENGTKTFAGTAWIGDFYWYDGTFTLVGQNKVPNVRVISNIYFSIYKEVKNITLDQYGTLTINYSSGEPDVFTKAIKWINNVDLSNQGVLTVNYNTEDSQELEEAIKWIDGIVLGNDGTLTINYNTEDTQEFDKAIKWIDNVSLSNDGILTVNYNTGTSEATNPNNKIQWIDSIELSNNNDNGLIKGHLYVKLNTENNKRDFGLVGFTEKGIYVQGNDLWIESNSNNNIDALMSDITDSTSPNYNPDISTEKAYAINIYVQAIDANTLPVGYEDSSIYKIVQENGAYHVYTKEPSEAVVDQIAVAYYDTAANAWKSLGSLDSSKSSVAIPEDQPMEITSDTLDTPWLP